MTSTINASTTAGIVTTADTSGVLALQTAGTTAVTVDASQNVGIGTSSPTGKLHVSAPASTQYGTFDAVTAAYAFTNYKVGGTVYGYIGDASGLVTGGTAGDFAVRFTGAMVFSGGANERMRISSAGDVGIGTTGVLNYTARLKVLGPTNQTVAELYGSGTNNTAMLALANDAGSVGIAAVSGNAVFYTNGITTERMRIDSSGNLLVASTSQINPGSGTQAGINLNAIGQIVGSVNSDTNYFRRTGTDGNLMVFYKVNSAVGGISVTGSATAYATSSDYRLKENIMPMTGGLAKVSALKPVTYKWKADGSDGQGFIAHELAEVVPQCVIGEKDAIDVDGNPVYQGIDTSFLVATLTAALQEQQALITQLQADVAALKGA